MPKYTVTYSITHQAIEVTVDVPDFDPENEEDFSNRLLQEGVTDISDKRFNHWLDKASLERADPMCPECDAELNVVIVEWELVNIEEVPDGNNQ